MCRPSEPVRPLGSTTMCPSANVGAAVGEWVLAHWQHSGGTCTVGAAEGAIVGSVGADVGDGEYQSASNVKYAPDASFHSVHGEM